MACRRSRGLQLVRGPPISTPRGGGVRKACASVVPLPVPSLGRPCVTAFEPAHATVVLHLAPVPADRLSSRPRWLDLARVRLWSQRSGSSLPENALPGHEKNPCSSGRLGARGSLAQIRSILGRRARLYIGRNRLMLTTTTPRMKTAPPRVKSKISFLNMERIMNCHSGTFDDLRVTKRAHDLRSGSRPGWLGRPRRAALAPSSGARCS